MKKLLLLFIFSFCLFTSNQAQEYAAFELTGTQQGTGTFMNAALSNFSWQVSGTLYQEVQILDDEVFDDGNEFENMFGQADFEQNLRIQIVSNSSGTEGQVVTSTATLTLNFEQFTPANKWGFCVVDLDVENCLISAVDENDNSVNIEDIDSWLIELFDCDLVEDGVNIPKWDASNAALLGSDTPEDYTVYNNLIIGGMPSNEASAAFFKPDIPIKSLTIYFENLQVGANVSLHFYLASLNPTGLEENEVLQWNIFPNPAKDKFKVQRQKAKVGQATLEIYDLNGRKLIEQNISTGNTTTEIDVSGLPNGIYFCTVVTAKGNATQKLIIQK